MVNKGYFRRSRLALARVHLVASVAFCFARGVVTHFTEMFGSLFAKREVVLWAKSLPVIPVFKGVFTLKIDKVRDFFSFLRVKQSWIGA